MSPKVSIHRATPEVSAIYANSTISPKTLVITLKLSRYKYLLALRELAWERSK